MAQHLDRPVPLPDEVADDLDAVAAEVDDRAAAGQPPVPEPRRMRSGVRLARADPGHVPDRSALDRADRLERLRRVAEVLEVAGEHARALDRVEHPLRLLGGPPERLRAQDRLAGVRGDRDGLFVHEVRHSDDHDVGLRVADRRLQVRGQFGDAPAFLEGGAAFRAARVDDADGVAATLSVEGHRVEVADEPGPEHRDRSSLHRCIPSLASRTAVGKRIRSSRRSVAAPDERGTLGESPRYP